MNTDPIYWKVISPAGILSLGQIDRECFVLWVMTRLCGQQTGKADDGREEFGVVIT